MKKTFWDRTAKIYDHFMKKDHKAYKQMYSLIYPVVRHKQVLELATGMDWFVRHVYEKTGFFTPPYETVDSLKVRLEEMYDAVEIGNVKGIAWFVCRKGENYGSKL